MITAQEALEQAVGEAAIAEMHEKIDAASKARKTCIALPDIDSTMQDYLNSKGFTVVDSLAHLKTVDEYEKWENSGFGKYLVFWRPVCARLVVEDMLMGNLE